MKPSVDYRDPQSVTKLRCDALLEAALALVDPPEFLVGLAIATELPRPPAAAPERLLVVRSGVWDEWSSATATNRCRLVAWDPDPDTSWDIAAWFHAQLLSLPGDADVVSYQYFSGPLRAIDPDYESPIAACTLRARMRPAIL